MNDHDADDLEQDDPVDGADERRPPYLRQLDAYRDSVGRVPDLVLAALAGVSVSAARRYRAALGLDPVPAYSEWHRTAPPVTVVSNLGTDDEQRARTLRTMIRWHQNRLDHHVERARAMEALLVQEQAELAEVEARIAAAKRGLAPEVAAPTVELAERPKKRKKRRRRRDPLERVFDDLFR